MMGRVTRSSRTGNVAVYIDLARYIGVDEYKVHLSLVDTSHGLKNLVHFH